ncbi:MAG: hypothetical protein H6945_20450 [Zoogloeaceae bacterium]|nr:hypothetical protein [Rhodocyclaceae bacterium]MCP5238104.1 hypothetical protein [Zoogloeaceae bacterium]
MCAITTLRGLLSLALVLGAGVAGAAATSPSVFRALLGPDQQVPFPLPRLLALIDAQLAPGGAAFAGRPAVLVPLGRSLQRHAAGDADYFRYPRVVVAVTGEPRDTAAPLLRDRLYLGYHEKAGVLEVISYAPGRGRFEFELVDDYRPGASPRLRAANRSLCLACHQNGAPLFARQTWDETSASPRIAELLAATGRDYYGLDWRRGVDLANAIDDATDRSNLLSVAQRVWQVGCGPGEPGMRCRARLWRLALRSRFSGVPVSGTLIAEPALAPLRAHADGDWRDGIEIPNPDIPNRLPFAALPPEGLAGLDADVLRRAADVAAAFDPLTVRAPIARWRLDQPDALARVVGAIAGFLSPAEIVALRESVLRIAQPAVREQWLSCRWRQRAARRDIVCTGAGGVSLSGRATADRLRIDRFATGAGMVSYGNEFVVDDGGYRSHGAVVRDTDGAALRRLAVAGSELRAVWVDEFAAIDTAIAEQLGNAGAGPFGDGLLSRERLLAPLLARFGLPAPSPKPLLPALAAASATPAGAIADTELQPFYRHCAACHDSADAFPPGFLGGTAEQVRTRLASCAPRMLRRLAMWQLPRDARGKTPMPPPASAQAVGFAASAGLGAMRDYLERSLRSQGLDPAGLSATAYADLPACAIH